MTIHLFPFHDMASLPEKKVLEHGHVVGMANHTETRNFRFFILLFSLRYANINSLGLAADLSHIEQDVNVSVQVVKIYFSG